ncbi:MAG: tetratricopeptide repeat protein [Muribaculaceae bacterium]|jgi:tetratricopeptide (TPR) repeat protein|nr:tetratricopeptide repeat protein [Muribaculaceae bacterium]
MKSFLAILFSLAFPFMVFAQDITQKANDLYSKDNFNEALELYLNAAKTKGTSSELYYNIGNTYYRLGNMGKSILYYERALILNPSNADAKTNLDFVNGKIQNNADIGASFLSNLIDSLISRESSNSWAIIGVVCFLLFLGAVALYIFASSVPLRKLGFFGGAALLLFTIVAISCSSHLQSKAMNHEYAIVTVSSTTLSTSPRVPKDKSEEAFLLNEGMKVQIVDSVENKTEGVSEKWYDVKADDSHRAWISSKAVEII